MADSAVQVVIGANVEELRRGAREAAGHVESLRGTMLEMKAEATQTGRAARFFANDIAALVPVSGEAKSAVAGLFEVMLAGNAIGLAVGSLKLLAEGFKLLVADTHEAAEELKKFVEDSKKQTEQLKASVESMLLALHGATRAQLLDFAQTHEAIEREHKLVKDLAAAELELAAAKAQEVAVGELGFAFSGIDVAAREKQIASLREQLKAIQDIIAAKRAQIAPLAAGDAAADAAKEELEFQKRTTEAMLADFAHFQQEKKKLYDADTQAATDGLRKWLDAQAKAEAEALKALREDGERRLKYRVDLDQRQAAIEDAEAAKTKQRAEAVARAIEHSLSTAFHEIITGSKSVGDAMAGLFASLATAAIDMLFKILAQKIVASVLESKVDSAKATAEVTHNAGIAGAEVAAALAPVLLFGAVGAGAAMASMVEGAFAPMALASRGWDLPSGGPFPTILHSREMVLPEELADRVRDGSGGGDINIHLHGMIDGDHLMRMVASDPFRRALREARRNGLL